MCLVVSLGLVIIPLFLLIQVTATILSHAPDQTMGEVVAVGGAGEVMSSPENLIVTSTVMMTHTVMTVLPTGTLYPPMS